MSSDVSLYWMKTGNARKGAGGSKKIKVRGERGGKRRKREVGGKARKVHRWAGKRRKSVGPKESRPVERSTRNGQAEVGRTRHQDTFPWAFPQEP